MHVACRNNDVIAIGGGGSCRTGDRIPSPMTPFLYSIVYQTSPSTSTSTNATDRPDSSQASPSHSPVRVVASRKRRRESFELSPDSMPLHRCSLPNDPRPPAERAQPAHRAPSDDTELIEQLRQELARERAERTREVRCRSLATAPARATSDSCDLATSCSCKSSTTSARLSRSSQRRSSSN